MTTDAKKADTMMAHAAEVARWAEDARRELAKCLERGDTKQAGYWAEKVAVFEKSVVFWRENAATFRPGARRPEPQEHTK